MMHRTLAIATLAFALAVAPRPPAWAAPPADEAEYVRGVVGRAAAHVEAGRYEKALAVLDQAERERPLPVFVYVRATIEERRGECPRAVELYQRFLELDVAAEDAEDARRGVARCRGDTEPTASPTTPPTDPPRADAPSREPSSPATPPRPWYTDPWGGALAATGAVGLGVGLGLVIRSRVDARAAADATDLQTFDDRSRRAVTLDRAGLATLAIGSALLLGGAIRWTLLAKRSRRHTAWTPHPSASGLVLRF